MKFQVGEQVRYYPYGLDADPHPETYVVEKCETPEVYRIGNDASFVEMVTPAQLKLVPGPKMYRVYLLRCKDNSLYCGIAIDVDRRFRQHCDGKGDGAIYTRTRRPLVLVATSPWMSHSEAARLENEVKRLRKEEKEAAVRRGHV